MNGGKQTISVRTEYCTHNFLYATGQGYMIYCSCAETFLYILEIAVHAQINCILEVFAHRQLVG